MKKRFAKGLLYLTVALPIIWLGGGIVLYLQRNIIAINWQSIFLLKENPLWSLVLILLFVFFYWASANHILGKLVKWVGKFKSLNRTIQATIVLSVSFYISLVVAALLFPRFTGYTFKSDLSLLTTAAIPLLALVVLILIEKASLFKAKFAGIEVEFQRAITTPISQTVTLEENIVTKSFTHDLRRITEEIDARQEKPHILIVRIGRRRSQMRIEFLALRDYVYELSKIAPIEYIVFVDENNEYLGFMTAERFKAKYPKFGIERLLEDFERDEGASARLERFFSVKFSEVLEALEDVKHDLVLPLWNASRNRQRIENRDLPRLGAIRLYLQKPTVLEAYRRMIEHKVPGIPVVDEKRKFLGVADKDKITQEVITQLLEKGQV